MKGVSEPLAIFAWNLSFCKTLLVEMRNADDLRTPCTQENTISLNWGLWRKGFLCS